MGNKSLILCLTISHGDGPSWELKWHFFIRWYSLISGMIKRCRRRTKKSAKSRQIPRQNLLPLSSEEFSVSLLRRVRLAGALWLQWFRWCSAWIRPCGVSLQSHRVSRFRWPYLSRRWGWTFRKWKRTAPPKPAMRPSHWAGKTGKSSDCKPPRKWRWNGVARTKKGRPSFSGTMGKLKWTWVRKWSNQQRIFCRGKKTKLIQSFITFSDFMGTKTFTPYFWFPQYLLLLIKTSNLVFVS